MKKLISVFLSIVILLSAALSSASAAYANSSSSAVVLTLNQPYTASVSKTESKTVSFWASFYCAQGGSYEVKTTGTATAPDNVYLTVYDSSLTNIINYDVVADENTTEKLTVTEFTAGSVYYLKYTADSSEYSFNINISLHNHSFYSAVVRAVADEDAEKQLNGSFKSVCSVCGYSYDTQAIYAPSYAVLSQSTLTASGLPLTPSVTVYDVNGGVVSPTEYTVTYEDNLDPGTACVYITFNSIYYYGELTSSFIIKPKKMTASSVKSKKKKQLTYTWTKDTTVTGYELQYGTSSKFSKSKTKVVTITKNSSKSKTLKKLSSGKKYYVRIRSYKTIDGVKYYGSWSKKLSVKVK